MPKALLDFLSHIVCSVFCLAICVAVPAARSIGILASGSSI